MHVEARSPSLPSQKQHVVVIGLDSYDPDLLQRWSRAGRLPFLTSLMEKGAWARLISTQGLFSDSPWPSFNTGVNPGKHGFYSYYPLRRGTTQIVRASPRDCRYPPFWSLLRNAGKKVAIFDVPKAFPLPGVDGLQAIGWGEHYPLLRSSSLPPALIQELNARFGAYRHPGEVIDPGFSHEVRLYERMMANVEKKLRATQHLFDQDDWDLFMSVFSEAHYGGHQLLHHADAEHWAHDPSADAVLGDSLARIYSRLDAAVAELCAVIPAETTVFIVAVHGIATNYSANDLVPAALERLGFQVPSQDRKDGSIDGGQGRSFAGGLRDLIPPVARAFIHERILPEAFHDRLFAWQYARNIDWQRSKAFFLPSDHFQGYISVNLRGREPYGIIEPGLEYDQVCNDISAELGRLVNPLTGRPAIREVVRIRQVYQGSAVDALPDLVICWADDGPISALHHPGFGTLSRGRVKLRRAKHGPDGFVIAAGNHIKSRATVTGANTMDLAPTILHLLGQPIPRDMDGRVLVELLDDDFTSSHPCTYEDQPFIVPEEMWV